MSEASRQRSRGLVALGVTLLALAMTTASPPAAVARSGDLDRSFGYLGAVVVQDPVTANGWDRIALQDDGKILTGTGYPAILRRLLPDGSVDRAFGEDGIVAIEEHGAIADIAVQRDGRIVVLTAVFRPGYVVDRLTADGVRDRTFGEEGRARSPQLPELCGPGAIDPSRLAPGGLALQRDGKTVLAGTLTAITFGGRGSWICDSDVAVVRLTPNGVPDRRFGRGGIATVDFGERWGIGNAVALPANGHLVIGGSSCAVEGFSGGMHTYTRTCSPDQTGMILGLTPGGELDPSFGTVGIATTEPGVDYQTRSLASLPNGSVVAVTSSHHRSTVSRWSARGVLDRSFGDGGNVELPLRAAQAVALDRRGGTIVVGGLGDWSGIARLQPDGRIDGRFGFAGVVATLFDGFATDVAVQRDGRIVVVSELVLGHSFASAAVRLLGPR